MKKFKVEQKKINLQGEDTILNTEYFDTEEEARQYINSIHTLEDYVAEFITDTETGIEFN